MDSTNTPPTTDFRANRLVSTCPKSFDRSNGQCLRTCKAVGAQRKNQGAPHFYRQYPAFSLTDSALKKRLVFFVSLIGGSARCCFAGLGVVARNEVYRLSLARTGAEPFVFGRRDRRKGN